MKARRVLVYILFLMCEVEQTFICLRAICNFFFCELLIHFLCSLVIELVDYFL